MTSFRIGSVQIWTNLGRRSGLMSYKLKVVPLHLSKQLLLTILKVNCHKVLETCLS